MSDTWWRVYCVSSGHSPRIGSSGCGRLSVEATGTRNKWCPRLDRQRLYEDNTLPDPQILRK